MKMIVKNRSVDFIFGTTGCGKSYFLVHSLIPEIEHKRIILLDRLDEYGTNYKLRNFIVTNKITDVIMLCKKLNYPKIIFKISKENKNDFITICRLVLALDDICFIIDEISNYPDRNNEFLDEIIRCGRHKSQSVIIISQCPVDVPPDYRQNISNIFFFKMLEKRYLDYCKSIIGDRADTLITLKQGEFIKYPDCVLNPL